jgi:hypothetical protein
MSTSQKLYETSIDRGLPDEIINDMQKRWELIRKSSAVYMWG